MAGVHFDQGGTAWTGALTQRPGLMTPTGGWQLLEQLYVMSPTGWKMLRDFVPPSFGIAGTLEYVAPDVYNGIQQYRVTWPVVADPTAVAYHYKVAVQWYENGVAQPMADPTPQTDGHDGTHSYNSDSLIQCETWYVSDSGESVKYTTNSLTQAPALENIHTLLQNNASGTDYNQIYWTGNGAIYSGSGHSVLIYLSGSELGSVEAYIGRYDAASPPQANAGDPGAVQKTFTYTLELREATTVLNTYQASVTGYYLPPTEIPSSPWLSSAGSGSVYASWSNSRNDLEVEIEWFRDGSKFGGSILPPGSTNDTLGGWPAGFNATAHVRYRNLAGGGTYSSMSNTLVT